MSLRLRPWSNADLPSPTLGESSRTRRWPVGSRVGEASLEHEADRWLFKIHVYIALDSPVNAFNVVQSIYQRAQILRDFPQIGQAYRSASGRDLRILLWGHYRIVYRLVANEEVHVIGVFHGAMRLENCGSLKAAPQEQKQP